MEKGLNLYAAISGKGAFKPRMLFLYLLAGIILTVVIIPLPSF